MAGLIESDGAWVSKVPAEWNPSFLHNSLNREEDTSTAESELTIQTAGLTIDQVGRDQKSVAGPYDPYLSINRLPTELLLSIFHYVTPGVKYPLKITHVCQLWRIIAIGNGSLWTNVGIEPLPFARDESFRRFLSLLDLQLERTQSFPLDVTWRIYEGSDRTDVIIEHLRSKAPFRRWRSLSLFLAARHGQNILPTGSFRNLESLLVVSGGSHQILTTINQSTTSKLRTLNISIPYTRDEDIERLYGDMLKRVTHLVLRGNGPGDTVDRLPPIPPNVIDIETERKWNHPFPHVKRYKLTYGIFRAGSTFDLKSLTSLTVTSSLTVQSDFHLVLPLLGRSVCAYITLGTNAVLAAPQLAELEFCNLPLQVFDATRDRVGYINNILEHPGFLLSPKSLLLEPSLPPDVIIKMLTQFSRLEKLELRFGDDMSVGKVTVAIGGEASGSDAICPRLAELKVRFTKKYRAGHQVEWWKGQAAEIVQGRKGCAAALRIYGTWYEGETFMLLA